MDLQGKLWLTYMSYNSLSLYIPVIEMAVQIAVSQQLKITEVQCIVQLFGEFPKLRYGKTARHSTQLCKLKLVISIQMAMTDPLFF